MTLSEGLTQDLEEAMKQRGQVKLDDIRMIRSQLKYAQIQKGTDFSFKDEILVLQKEAKKRKEAIKANRQADVLERMEREKAELAVIREFLPKAFTDEEFGDIID